MNLTERERLIRLIQLEAQIEGPVEIKIEKIGPQHEVTWKCTADLFVHDNEELVRIHKETVSHKKKIAIEAVCRLLRIEYQSKF